MQATEGVLRPANEREERTRSMRRGTSRHAWDADAIGQSDPRDTQPKGGRRDRSIVRAETDRPFSLDARTTRMRAQQIAASNDDTGSGPPPGADVHHTRPPLPRSARTLPARHTARHVVIDRGALREPPAHRKASQSPACAERAEPSCERSGRGWRVSAMSAGRESEGRGGERVLARKSLNGPSTRSSARSQGVECDELRSYQL